MQWLPVFWPLLVLVSWPGGSGGDLGASTAWPAVDPAPLDERVQAVQVPGAPVVPPPAATPLRPSVAPVRPAPPSATPPVRPASPPSTLLSGVSPLAGTALSTASSLPPGPGLTSLDRAAAGGIPLMLGDQAPIFGRAHSPAGAVGSNSVRLPWVRGYKMADNQTPWPVDRVFFAFNYYDDINIGQAAGNTLRNIKVYREFFGLEKTFLDDRNASIGLRLPLNTLSATSTTAGLGGTSTALGDLTVYGKYAFGYDREQGRVNMVGLAVTSPTGPSEFAGASFAQARSPVYFQPFVGYVRSAGPLFLLGFTGVNAPTDGKVVTMLYNDVGIGYTFHRSTDPDRLIGAIVPTMEVHVNTPLNHRGTFSAIRDPGATFDVVDLTFGLSVWLKSRLLLSVGFSESVTGPRPFAGEIVTVMNFFYGRTPQRIPPPSL